MNEKPGMGYVGFSEENDSRETEEILGGSQENNEEKNEETAVFNRQQAKFNFDLNLQPEEVDSGLPEKQVENSIKSEAVEIFGSPSKKRRFTVEEKGKAILVEEQDDEKMILDLDWGTMQADMDEWIASFDSPVEAQKENYNEIEVLGSANTLNLIDRVVGEVNYRGNDEMVDFQSFRRNEESRRHEIAKSFAQKLAHEVNPEGEPSKSSTQTNKNGTLRSVVIDEDNQAEDSQSPFGMAMEMIKTRNLSSTPQRNGRLVAEFKWVPRNNRRSFLMAREVSSLLDLCLRTLAKHTEAMVSLECVPDMLRHKLSQLVCNSRKMDSHFLELLASGSPTEIRVNNCSRITEDEFTRIFGCCDSRNLIVLQLDLCGSCIPDYVLEDTLARSPNSLPALVTLSLNGAFRLSDNGLSALAMSAPALQSINLSQCSLLRSAGINNLASCFESTLKELYLDDCHDIEAMVVLPGLKKLKCLEVLSLAGIRSVCDDFVIEMVEACYKNMKELVFANCVKLTDLSLKFVGKNCSRLCALDLSYLCNLTDLSVRYLANGCRSLKRLKLCRNGFSDEAIAAFLEASGSSLTELALNNVTLVGPNTALSLAKCSRKLVSLDLSWCRNLPDEALGLIVDSCVSLRLLKLFGCTQITEVFLYGHSNARVQIIGPNMAIVSEHLNALEPQQAPLRYSPINSFC